MNILVFADVIGPGGTERAFRVLVNELLRDNHEVTLITSREAPGYKYATVPEAFVDNPFFTLPSTTKQALVDVLSGHHFDAVVYGLMFNYGVLRFMNKYNIPSVRYLHVVGTVCPNNQKYRFGERKVCTEAFGLHCVTHRKRRGCGLDGGLNRYSLLGFLRSLTMNYASKYWDSRLDRIIVNSEYVRTLYLQSGYPSNKLVLSHPPNRFLGGTAVPMHSSKNPNRRIVLFSGRVIEIKGLPELKEILSRLPDNAELRVAGVGKGVEELEQYVAENGLQDKFVRLGFLDDVDLKEQLQCANVCVMPSHLPETYGLSGVEAIALGTPVVAYDVGGVREWLASNNYGSLIPPESPQRFVEAVLEILSTPWRITEGQTNVNSARRYVSEFYQHIAPLLRERGRVHDEFSPSRVNLNQ